MRPFELVPERIETARLLLRRPLPGDEALCARLLHEAYETRDVPLDTEQAARVGTFLVHHWLHYGFGQYIIEANGLPVGMCGVKFAGAFPDAWAIRDGDLDLGYSLIPSCRGKGLATEAAAAAIDPAFRIFPVSHIVARCDHDNQKSADVLIHIGMVDVEPSENSRRFHVERA